jgi:DNA-binding HxlR family transcriptional regulator
MRNNSKKSKGYGTQPARGNVSDKMCPSRMVLDHLTSRWGILILLALLEGTHRFSVLGRRIGGVSEKMLAQTLQVLEADGFVLRTVYPTVPPRVEYSLTSTGRQAAKRLKVLTDWVEENAPQVMQVRSKSLPRNHPTFSPKAAY